MPIESITREELDRSSRSELNDDIILHLVSVTFGVSIHQIIRSSLVVSRGAYYESHAERLFENFWHTGHVPQDTRRYAINCLLGRTPLIIDEEATTAVLLV